MPIPKRSTITSLGASYTTVQSLVLTYLLFAISIIHLDLLNVRTFVFFLKQKRHKADNAVNKKKTIGKKLLFPLQTEE
jgi:hypothetical protein